MSVEALARALCAADGHQPDDRDITMLALRPYAMWERYITQAALITADPAPLLAALAEAGVLEVEWNVAGVDSEGCEWTAGLQDDEPPTLSAWMKRDNGHHESRYVSGWTEVPR